MRGGRVPYIPSPPFALFLSLSLAAYAPSIEISISLSALTCTQISYKNQVSKEGTCSLRRPYVHHRQVRFSLTHHKHMYKH
ncbi:hypothetical protein BKA57DRAFT_460402, partial [Linnemannia elongata]